MNRAVPFIATTPCKALQAFYKPLEMGVLELKIQGSLPKNSLLEMY